MKTAEEIIKELRDNRLHTPNCICLNCKHGVEVFHLLEKDVQAIQLDALKKASEIADSCEAQPGYYGLVSTALLAEMERVKGK